MNLLLDTHALLWTLSDSDKLKPKTREAIRDRFNLVFVSPVSLWEIDIKRRLGKLEAPTEFSDILIQMNFMELPVSIDHAEALAQLPDHHKDPFDRMLIAQAVSEGLTLVTRDQTIPKYDVHILAA